MQQERLQQQGFMGNLDGMAWAASAMEASQFKLETASQNIANNQVYGFHHRVAEISMTANGLTSRTHLDMESGGQRVTWRPFDLAIAGAGSFRVAAIRGKSEVPVGRDIALTRYGRFVLDEKGHLVNEQRQALIGKDGKFVRITQSSRANEDGTFADPDGKVTGAIALEKYSKLHGAHLETATGNPVTEMVSVLDAQRSFETNEKVLSVLDQVKEKSITDVGEIK
jgi:flagellar basal body rod protein FlgG